MLKKVGISKCIGFSTKQLFSKHVYKIKYGYQLQLDNKLSVIKRYMYIYYAVQVNK